MPNLRPYKPELETGDPTTGAAPQPRLRPWSGGLLPGLSEAFLGLGLGFAGLGILDLGFNSVNLN